MTAVSANPSRNYSEPAPPLNKANRNFISAGKFWCAAVLPPPPHTVKTRTPPERVRFSLGARAAADHPDHPFSDAGGEARHPVRAEPRGWPLSQPPHFESRERAVMRTATEANPFSADLGLMTMEACSPPGRARWGGNRPPAHLNYFTGRKQGGSPDMGISRLGVATYRSRAIVCDKLCLTRLRRWQRLNQCTLNVYSNNSKCSLHVSLFACWPVLRYIHFCPLTVDFLDVYCFYLLLVWFMFLRVFFLVFSYICPVICFVFYSFIVFWVQLIFFSRFVGFIYRFVHYLASQVFYIFLSSFPILCKHEFAMYSLLFFDFLSFS